jgi:3-deoxy-D-manno-octulosonic-acid transferase
VAIVLYNLLVTVLFASLLPALPILALSGSRYRYRLGQRFAIYPSDLIARFKGVRPIWIHAASLGEVRSVAALVAEIKRHHPQRKILLSSFTATGHQAAVHLAGVDAAILLPLDLYWIVRRALARWNPAQLVIVETELWPNMVFQAFRRGIPTLLLSGRISERSRSRYALLGRIFRPVLHRFSRIGAQTDADARRFLSLGAPAHKVAVVGSLKFADSQAAAASPKLLGGKPASTRLFVAASTHRGEDEILLDAFQILRQRFNTVVMVLAPRHPERFATVEALLRSRAVPFRRRSKASVAELFDRDVVLLDTLGELVDFFAHSDLAFVGGSLVPVGGHNVLEPALGSVPVLFGPHMDHFRAVADRLKNEGAAREIHDAASLAAAAAEILIDPALRTQMGERALAVARSGVSALAKNYQLVDAYLMRGVAASGSGAVQG